MSDPCASLPMSVYCMGTRKNCIYCTTTKKKKTQIRIAALSCQPLGPFKQPGLGKEKKRHAQSRTMCRMPEEISASLRPCIISELSLLVGVMQTTAKEIKTSRCQSATRYMPRQDKPPASQKYYASFTSFIAAGLSPRCFESHSRRRSGPM